MIKRINNLVLFNDLLQTELHSIALYGPFQTAIFSEYLSTIRKDVVVLMRNEFAQSIESLFWHVDVWANAQKFSCILLFTDWLGTKRTVYYFVDPLGGLAFHSRQITLGRI